MDSEPLPESGQYPALPHVFALLYRLARFFAAKSMPLDLLAYDMQEHIHGFFLDFAYLITDAQMLKSITFKVIDVWVTQELLITELRTAMNQPNEWDNMVGPSDSDIERRGPLRPYFSISGPVGLLGYQYLPYDRDRDTVLWDVPLTLSEAAELFRYDDVFSSSRSRSTGSRGGSRSASSRSRLRRTASSPRSTSSGGFDVRRSRSWTRSLHRSPPSRLSIGSNLTRSASLRSHDLRNSRFGGSMSPSPSTSVAPWSSLSNEEIFSRARSIISQAIHSMNRSRESHEGKAEVESDGSF
jgi:hypothetical protein